MFWREMDFHFLSQSACFGCRKRLVERGKNMGIEIVHHQNDFFCVRIMHVNHFTHEQGPIFLRSPFTDLDDAFACQWFSDDKHATDAFALILISLAFWLAFFHWQRLSCVRKQLFTSLIHTQLWETRIVGTFVHLQSVFHLTDKFSAFLWWNTILLL